MCIKGGGYKWFWFCCLYCPSLYCWGYCNAAFTIYWAGAYCWRYYEGNIMTVIDAVVCVGLAIFAGIATTVFIIVFGLITGVIARKETWLDHILARRAEKRKHRKRHYLFLFKGYCWSSYDHYDRLYNIFHLVRRPKEGRNMIRVKKERMSDKVFNTCDKYSLPAALMVLGAYLMTILLSDCNWW